MVLFIVLGIGANLILYCLLRAFKLIDASAVAPYRYTELIFSVLVGYYFFGENIDNNVAIGALVIIVATLFVIYESVLKRKTKLAS